MAKKKDNRIGKKHWLLRLDISEDGRKLSIEQVKQKAFEYISMCINEPIEEDDWVGKDSKNVKRKKPRAMIVEGLCAYLGITKNTWYEWRKDDKYKDITTRVEEIMYTYNFEHASAGQMNANIIARKLGLSNKTDITSDGKQINGPAQVVMPDGRSLEEVLKEKGL